MDNLELCLARFLTWDLIWKLAKIAWEQYLHNSVRYNFILGQTAYIIRQWGELPWGGLVRRI